MPLCPRSISLFYFTTHQNSLFSPLIICDCLNSFLPTSHNMYCTPISLYCLTSKLLYCTISLYDGTTTLFFIVTILFFQNLLILFQIIFFLFLHFCQIWKRKSDLTPRPSARGATNGFFTRSNSVRHSSVPSSMGIRVREKSRDRGAAPLPEQVSFTCGIKRFTKDPVPWNQVRFVHNLECSVLF